MAEEGDSYAARQLSCDTALRRDAKAHTINCFSVCSSFNCLTAQEPVTLVSTQTRGGGFLTHPAAAFGGALGVSV